MGDTDIFDGCARLCPESRIETVVVGGPDADDFLQRLLSCDLTCIERGSGNRGTLLDNKGRILAYFDVQRVEQGLLIVIEQEMVGVLTEQLERLIILEDVEVVTGAYAVLSIQGPMAPSKAEQLSEVVPDSFLATVPWRGGQIANRPRCPSSGFDLIVPVEQADEIERELEAMSVPQACPESSEQARIEAGLPRIGHEITARSLPPEVGLDDAISYDKGCYVGQEVLARIRTYGHVNRQLRCLSISVEEQGGIPSIEVGDDLFCTDDDAKVVAKVTSRARGDGVVHLLASVKRSHTDEGTELIWKGQAGQTSIRHSAAVRLPFHP